jgi:hypothetical protein
VCFSEKAEISALGSEPIVAGQPPVGSEPVVAGQPPVGSEPVVAVQPDSVDHNPYKPCGCGCELICEYPIYYLTNCVVSCIYFPEECGRQNIQRMTHACFMCGFCAGMYDVGRSKQVPCCTCCTCCTCCSDYWTCFECHNYVSWQSRDSIRGAPDDEVCPSNPCTYLCMFYYILHGDGVGGDNLCCVDCIGHIIMTAGCAPIFLPIASVNCVCNILYFILCAKPAKPTINVGC